MHAAAEEGVQIGNGDDIPAGQIRWSVEWQACSLMPLRDNLVGMQYWLQCPTQDVCQ